MPLAVAVVLAGLVATPAGSVARAHPQQQGPGGCEEHPPSFTYSGRSGSLPPPWAGGTDLGHAPPLDTDGDGTTDTVTDLPDGALRITRSSGSLEFGSVYWLNSSSASDLDGDGRSDLILGVADSVDSSVTYVVPGSTADGAVDPSTAGIEIGFHGPVGVGDQTGDGIDDLAADTVFPGVGDIEIYSGADVMASGPGGTFSGPPAIVIPDSDLLGVLALEPGAPSLATSPDAGVGGTGISVVLGPAGVPALRLTTGAQGQLAPAETPGYQTGVSAYDVDGDIWVVLAQSSRSGSTGFGWRLDELTCEGHTDEQPDEAPAPPAAPAAPAAPTRGTARYTG